MDAPRTKIAIDCVIGSRLELELWRAGYEVPVKARDAEPDESWIERAVNHGCKVVITADKGVCDQASYLNMWVIYVFGLNTKDMLGKVLSSLERYERKRTECQARRSS